MANSNRSSQLFARYLRLLGVEKREPGLEALTEIVTAHLMSIPFETLSKLYYRKQLGLRALPGLQQYLNGIEQYNFGGTCYSNNYYLNRLLQHLGYEIKLCGADMENPDVHLVSLVSIDGHEYIVDVGYAAPFFKPMLRDLRKELVIHRGGDRYLLQPQDKQGRSRMIFRRDGQDDMGYIAKPEPRRIEEFANIIANSLTADAYFMNSLLMVRFHGDHSLIIRNLTQIEARGIESNISQLGNRAELVEAIVQHFGMPRQIVAEAIDEIGEFRPIRD